MSVIAEELQAASIALHFAALHESVHGPKAKCRHGSPMSAHGGIADVMCSL
jgi:hypothetical protein